MTATTVLNSPRSLLTVGHSYTLRANRRLAHAIQAAGGGRWEVTVAAPTYFAGHRDLRPAVYDPDPGEPVRVEPVPTHLTSRIHVFGYGRRLRRLLKRDWDLVHAWEEPYIRAGHQIASWVPDGVPYVFRTAQSLPKRYPPPFSWFERRAVARAAGWICSGQTVVENLLARPSYADMPMALIPLGVDLDAFRPDAAAGAATRRRLGWQDDGPPVVGFVGRFVPEKGWELLTRVLDRIRTPWRALFLGGGPDEARLRAWAAGHPDAVRVVGVAHAEVPQYLSAMDLMAAPSQTASHWREQFGRMLIEAFAAGVPVVGSDSGEIPNVIGDAGIVVGEKDEDGWRDTLGSLIQSPNRRAALATAGLERAHQFTWDEVGRLHVEFFDRVLASHGRAVTSGGGRRAAVRTGERAAEQEEAPN